MANILIPDFTMGQTARVDFSQPLNVLSQWRQEQDKAAQLAENRRQFEATNSLAQANFGLHKRDSDLAYNNALAQKAAFDRIMADPNSVVSRDPAIRSAIEIGGYTAAPNVIVQGRNTDLQRQQLALQAQTLRMQQEQAKAQSPQWRLENSPRFGIDPNSQEGREFVINGVYKPTEFSANGVTGELFNKRTGEVQATPGGTAVDHIVEGIVSGRQQPDLTGLYKQTPQVRAALEKRGFNLAESRLQWDAAHKQIQSLSGPQMTRYIGLSNSVVATIDRVKELSAQMKNSGLTGLNAAKIAILINTQGNTPQGQLATNYMTAVNTLKEEFANLAMGGNAPTEPAWHLANQQINGNYGVDQLTNSLGEVQRLVNYRLQAIPNIQTLGPGAANRYTGNSGQPQGHGAAPAQGAGPPPPPGMQQAQPQAAPQGAAPPPPPQQAMPDTSRLPVGATINHPQYGPMQRGPDGKWYPVQGGNR